jgi:hypothetical protein
VGIEIMVENIDQKDFGKTLHDTAEMKDPIQRVIVVVDRK